MTLLCENDIQKKYIKIERQTKQKIEGEVEYKIWKSLILNPYLPHDTILCLLPSFLPFQY